MKTLLLASNGSYAIQKGMKLLFPDISKMKLAYITTAVKGSKNPDYFKQFAELLKYEGYNFEEIDIEGKNADELEQILKDKDAVFVEGGNSFYLLRAIRASGFDRVIKKLIERGVPYIGVSAGSYITCPTIEVAAWKKPGKEKDNFGVTDLTAMNLVPFLLKAHYAPEKKAFLQEKIAQTKYPVRILTDEQAILAKDDMIELVGEGLSCEIE
jgi:dipeptidase E